jgi:FMN phosphatase YigB (HAD superfamily)
MLVIDSDKVTFFDVDDTLVKWSFSQEEADQYGIKFNNFGYETLLVPHRTHIEQLKKHRARGHKIIVWSAGGYDWAAEVVKVLGLEDAVDLVISKPTWFYDDLPASHFLPEGNRIYIKDGNIKPEPKPTNAHSAEDPGRRG